MPSIVLVVMLGLGMLSLSSCGKRLTWHQKLTVTVITPDGVKSASSVQEGEVERYAFCLNGFCGNSATRGEAVALEVALSRYLFALVQDGLA